MPHLLFLDDAAHKNCNRPGMGPLLAVGGLSVALDKARTLDNALDSICKKYGFPSGEAFKWSPAKDHWMRKNIIDDNRVNFLIEIISACELHECTALCTIVDTTKKLATSRSITPEMDVLVMALERFENFLAGNSGIVIVACPPGGRTDETKFLMQCSERLATGTSFVKFQSIATNVLTMPFNNSRVLQAADIIASTTCAMFAGHTEFAKRIFPYIIPIFRKQMSTIGGWGVKIHPDYNYENLYYWLLGDTHFFRGNVGTQLPNPARPYAKDPKTR